MAKVVIVIPTYNEKENIKPLLESLFRVNPQFEVLFVDDNSPDQTAQVIREVMLSNPRVHLLSRKIKQGLGKAYIQGFREALALEPDYIVQMDADLSHDPKYIPLMLEEAKRYDLVIGSRYIRGGGSLDWSWPRAAISRIGIFFLRVITGIKIRDALGGFKCFNAGVIRALDLTAIRSRGFFFQLEVNYFINQLGYTCKEIPIIFLKRNKGKSKFSVGIVWEAVLIGWRLRKK